MSGSFDYDAIIIGSGFGGSVSALRLAEKGLRTAVLEQGRRVSPGDMEAAGRNPLKLLWAPFLGLKGFFAQSIFKDVVLVRGVGVGGGSLVYAAVLLEPRDKFYRDPAWSSLGVDWKRELAPHYRMARRMLGIAENPYHDIMDDYLRDTARAMGAEQSFGPVPQGIYFGEAGVRRDDPFFHGRGPARTGCIKCGACLTGCPHNAKNSLDKNYLYLAEKAGCRVFPERRAEAIIPLPEGGYRVETRHPFRGRGDYPALTARKVILAAGVLGTLKLLFEGRRRGRLPGISHRLGEMTRTNSEAIVAVTSRDAKIDLSKGTAISSHFHPNEYTHITQNRFPRGYTFFKFYAGPLVDGARPLVRALKTMALFLIRPLRSTFALRARKWYKRVTVLTVMQDLDNRLTMKYGRSPFTFFRRGLFTRVVPGKEAPTYLPEANEAARKLASVSNGVPSNITLESIGALSSTAHILGGCPMGANANEGVIGTDHQVHGHPGLYVVDGSAVSANVGVNPSLTITALAERCISLMK